MTLRRVLRMGEELPRGYGVSFFEPARDEVVCYPVPLNILVAALRRLWHFLQIGLAHRPSELDVLRTTLMQTERSLAWYRDEVARLETELQSLNHQFAIITRAATASENDLLEARQRIAQLEEDDG